MCPYVNKKHYDLTDANDTESGFTGGRELEGCCRSSDSGGTDDTRRVRHYFSAMTGGDRKFYPELRPHHAPGRPSATLALGNWTVDAIAMIGCVVDPLLRGNSKFTAVQTIRRERDILFRADALAFELHFSAIEHHRPGREVLKQEHAKSRFRAGPGVGYGDGLRLDAPPLSLHLIGPQAPPWPCVQRAKIDLPSGISSMGGAASLFSSPLAGTM